MSLFPVASRVGPDMYSEPKKLRVVKYVLMLLCCLAQSRELRIALRLEHLVCRSIVMQCALDIHITFMCEGSGLSLRNRVDLAHTGVAPMLTRAQR